MGGKRYFRLQTWRFWRIYLPASSPAWMSRWKLGSKVSGLYPPYTPLKTNMDTENDGLEKVTPFKYGHFWYLCSISGVYATHLLTIDRNFQRDTVARIHRAPPTCQSSDSYPLMGSLGHLEPQTSKGKRLDGGKKEEVSTTKSPWRSQEVRING